MAKAEEVIEIPLTESKIEGPKRTVKVKGHINQSLIDKLNSNESIRRSYAPVESQDRRVKNLIRRGYTLSGVTNEDLIVLGVFEKALPLKHA